tara:strand:- start:714 stop:908 length:195 start_codon:yes stop_codon:yes gene_type:complete
MEKYRVNGRFMVGPHAGAMRNGSTLAGIEIHLNTFKDTMSMPNPGVVGEQNIREGISASLNKFS